MCGKDIMKNRPCFQKNVSCGQVCGRALRCGLHRCRKQCHRIGLCEDSRSVCGQKCGKLKSTCGHPCEKQCHGIEQCKEDKPCQSIVMITCDCQHLKNEAKCLATGTARGSSQRSLKCNDECAKLERNRKMALALNIDPDNHTNNHIPYSAQTLDMYQDHGAWCRDREDELRAFAIDEDEKTMRFKPMSAHQRAFIHDLAEDYGLDSESMDPEPHRHVSIFKTPRFVSIPMKTLAESLRTRNRTLAGPANAIASVRSAQKPLAKQAINGFLLSAPKFALTIEELHVSLSTILEKHSNLTFDTAFLPNEEIVLKAKPSFGSSDESEVESPTLESDLRALKPALSTVVTSKHLAGLVSLCALDSSLNVLRTEKDEVEQGWNLVASRGKAPKKEATVPAKSGLVRLGGRTKPKRDIVSQSKEQPEEVVDDWYEAVLKEEKVAPQDPGEGDLTKNTQSSEIPPTTDT